MNTARTTAPTGPRTLAGVGLAITASALVAPVIGAIVTVVGLLFPHKRAVPLAGLIAAIATTAALSAVNLSKTVSGDWIWYTQHYLYLRYAELDEYLGQLIGNQVPEPTEPLYYALSKATSVATNGSIEALTVVVTFAVYIPIGAACVIVAATATQRPGAHVVATVAGMLGGLTFTLSTQLVRQEIAASLVALGIVLAATKRLPLAGVALAAAVATHNSALIPAAGLASAFLLARTTSKWLPKAVLIGGAFYLLGWFYLNYAGGSAYEGQSDGSVSQAVIVLDVLLLLVFARMVMKTPLGENPVARTVLMCAPAFYGFLLAVSAQPLPFLRMYFYVEVLRGIMLCLVVVHMLSVRKWVAPLGLTVLILAVTYVDVRIALSPFEYGNTLFGVLLYSPVLEAISG